MQEAIASALIKQQKNKRSVPDVDNAINSYADY